MALESLKLLEAKLSGFLERHEQVQSANSALLVRIDEQEHEYALLLKQIQQYEAERNEIRSRLEKILTQFGLLGIALEDEG
ncbi:MAG: hypothetical protein OXC18_23790 [Desulfurellaceae bacterium]|nr:hypothetical protein [Desulfurellaceae bacterium]